jgi:PAT family beta-lactamase induction signal transducer AmpG
MVEPTQTGVRTRSPWLWVPTLYFAEGLPYVVVMTVSVIMYKRFGISNADIALYTSWLYLPWVIKPLWSPFVDLFSRKRIWIIVTQLVIGGALAAVALAVPLPLFFRVTLAIFWLMAFASATHDIAADGFYMLALPEHHQSAFVGVRNTFYRLAMIAGQGGIVVLAGSIEQWSGGNLAVAWSSAIAVLALLFPLFALYHKFLLPVPASDLPALGRTSGGLLQEFFRTFSLFFKKKDIIVILAFLLFYRFAEAQLVKLVPPFLLDVREKGGLGLSTSEVGVVYGTVGIVALTLGGLVGGYVVSRNGLKRWLWIMVLAIHLPDAVFVYLSQMQPEHFLVITSAVAIEQFGYGFGFTAYVLFMMMISAGEYRTAHYAICTGFMALGMMVPGMFSGFIQEGLGYKTFFLWILLSTIPGFIVAALVKIEPGYGMKREKEQL